MRYLSPALVLMGALMLPVPAAHAIPMTFVGNLSGANEIPPVNSLGTGLATVILDPTAQTIQINATFSGLTSNDMAAHRSALMSGSLPRFLRSLGSLWE